MPAKLFDAAIAARSPIDAPPGAGGAAMRIADLSLWRRAGVKGAAATELLGSRGATVPAVNMAARQGDGSLMLRLAENEYLALAGNSGAGAVPGGLPDFVLDGDNDPGICPVPRFSANAWFAVVGARLPEMFAKICGVDLRAAKFDNHRVAQTIVSRALAILVRDDLGTVGRFHIVVDWPTAGYLWNTLIDAMDEFGGAVIDGDELAGTDLKPDSGSAQR